MLNSDWQPRTSGKIRSASASSGTMAESYASLTNHSKSWSQGQRPLGLPKFKSTSQSVLWLWKNLEICIFPLVKVVIGAEFLGRICARGSGGTRTTPARPIIPKPGTKVKDG